VTFSPRFFSGHLSFMVSDFLIINLPNCPLKASLDSPVKLFEQRWFCLIREVNHTSPLLMREKKNKTQRSFHFFFALKINKKNPFLVFWVKIFMGFACFLWLQREGFLADDGAHWPFRLGPTSSEVCFS
jgi:hypothetical protein